MPQRPLEVGRAVAADAPVAARARLRRATAADIDVIVPMINAAYDVTEHDVFPNTRRCDRQEITAIVEQIVVAEVDGRVGACVHIDTSGDAAHYGLLAVDVSLHRSGLGSMLAQHAEQAAMAAGAQALRIETVKQAGLIPFYERLGFRVIAEADGQVWNGGADWGAAIPWQMVEMEKTLR
ncbi:MAG TPA: GNAT family N-acetyltransferase [Dehalococcoidia bacterium]|nr:GNAT family N-acetyltransferase [Dehalococcoidia bacterium]